MKKEKKTILCSIVIVISIVITGFVYQFYEGNKGMQEDVFVSEMIPVTEQAYVSEIPESVVSQETVRNCCYVCGAVNNPGVYEFLEGTRLDEVIALAGGFSSDAATEYLNLARAVCDSEKIYVPTVSELEEQSLTDMNHSTGHDVLRSDTEDKVNINTADIEELTTLPGIGTAKAKSILSYREEHGKFETIEELKNIDGIKDGVFQKIVDLIIAQ